MIYCADFLEKNEKKHKTKMTSNYKNGMSILYIKLKSAIVCEPMHSKCGE